MCNDEEEHVPATGERAPLIGEGRTNRDPQSQRRALTTPRLFSLARCNRTVVFQDPLNIYTGNGPLFIWHRALDAWCRSCIVACGVPRWAFSQVVERVLRDMDRQWIVWFWRREHYDDEALGTGL